MGFFDKLKNGLTKTKDAFFGQVNDVLKSFRRVDEDLLEEMEELLICADMGAEVIKIEGRGGDAWRATSMGHTKTGRRAVVARID